MGNITMLYVLEFRFGFRQNKGWERHADCRRISGARQNREGTSTIPAVIVVGINISRAQADISLIS
jgi:hypothetical protein